MARDFSAICLVHCPRIPIEAHLDPGPSISLSPGAPQNSMIQNSPGLSVTPPSIPTQPDLKTNVQKVPYWPMKIHYESPQLLCRWVLWAGPGKFITPNPYTLPHILPLSCQERFHHQSFMFWDSFQCQCFLFSKDDYVFSHISQCRHQQSGEEASKRSKRSFLVSPK